MVDGVKKTFLILSGAKRSRRTHRSFSRAQLSIVGAFAYMLRCADGSYYVGSTRDSLEVRVAQHNAGTFGGYTATRRPVLLVFHQEFERIVDAISAERKLKDQDIDLGIVPKTAIIDPAIANAAFALKTNEVSQPVKGQFGIALVQTLSIEPEKVEAFADAAPGIKRDIALERGKSEMANLRDKVEDELAGGSTLTEVAKKLKLASTEFDIDRSGRGRDGNPVQMPGGSQVLTSIFSTEVGVQADPVQYGDALAYYEVNGITPSRERKLDEVKDQVEQRWQDEQIGNKLKAQSAEMIDKLKAGSTLAELATAKGLKVETADGLTRIHPTEAISAAVLAAIFDTPKDAAGRAEAQPPDQIVFRVTKVNIPALDAASPDAKKIADTLRSSMTDAMLGEYLSRIESDVGTSINQEAAAQVLGGGAQQQ